MDATTTAASSAGRPDRGDPDPYPNYRWLRDNQPVCPMATQGDAGRTWLVTSYDLVRAGLADARLSYDDRNAAHPGEAEDFGEFSVSRGLLDLDAPEHTRLRKLVSAAFRPAEISGLRGRIEQICHRAVDSFVARGRADLVAEYALPVPLAVIHEVLGVPESERLDPARCFDLSYRVGFVQPRDPAVVRAIVDYVKHIAAYKRTHPGDDLTSGLLRSVGEEGGLRDENELHTMILAVLRAGHLSTVQFIGTAIVRLLERPADADRLLSGEVPWRAAVNEMLRYDAPVHAAEYRYALEDLEIGGTQVAKGDRLLMSIAAANRDPAKFDDPERFVVDRNARGDLSFGHGAHLCLGSHLARLEAEVALGVLFERLGDLRLAIRSADVAWAFGPMLRGPRAVPVTFDAA